ncbi:hypothetical protein ACGFZR_15185 [Streptomyces sp. NPDC048241]|uniref:hypothetical protein n=1 Tax=Streptomyces sp. NPDC048241 TaxID=3365521 RepID=UPI003720DD4C
MSKPSKKAIAEYADEMEKVAAYQHAEADLNENAAREARAGIREETPEYLRLNQAVIDAGKQLPERFKYLAK